LEKLGAQVVSFSDLSKDYLGIDNARLVLKGAGEYEVGGVEISGIGAGEGKVVYVYNVEGVRAGVVGFLDKPLDDKKLERIDGLDVLLVKLGEGQGVKDSEILGWAKKWGVNHLVLVGANGDGRLKSFLDEVDEEGLAPVGSVKIEKESLPEGMEVTVLGS